MLSTYINEFFTETVLETAYYKWVTTQGTGPHQQKAGVSPLVLHGVCCCAVSPDCPPFSTTTSPRTGPYSPTRTTLSSCQPWTALRPLGSTPMLTLPARSGRQGTYIMWSHDSHVTSSRALCEAWYALRCCLVGTGTCVCRASLLVCCLCSVSPCTTCVHIKCHPSKEIVAVCLAAGPCWTRWCRCSHSAQ